MAAHFEKCLTDTDTVGRLALPIDWLGILPPFELGSHEVEICVSDGSIYWDFRCSTTKMGRYRKPFLQPEGWLKFVDHKGLKVGDKIILDAEANDFVGSHFKIRAQRLNTEDDKWVDVSSNYMK